MSDRDCPHGRQIGKCADCDVERLEDENEALKTVMIAAAEEISAHWDAHCDDDGYGPVNLMHRLEKGIPSQYGYTAGDFDRVRALNAKLVAENETLQEELAEQSRLVGMGSEREARLLAINAELVEALRGWMNQPEDAATYDACMARAEAALAKVEASK